MLTTGSIFAALASTTTDQNTGSIVIGVGVILLILLMIASSGTSAKKVVKKYFCPHCHRQINFAASSIRTLPKYPPSAQGKRNLRVSSRSRKLYPLANAPVQRRNGKKYCPYCKKEIIE